MPYNDDKLIEALAEALVDLWVRLGLPLRHVSRRAAHSAGLKLFDTDRQRTHRRARRIGSQHLSRRHRSRGCGSRLLERGAVVIVPSMDKHHRRKSLLVRDRPGEFSLGKFFSPFATERVLGPYNF
jgi:hypothetical protein